MFATFVSCTVSLVLRLALLVLLSPPSEYRVAQRGTITVVSTADTEVWRGRLQPGQQVEITEHGVLRYFTSPRHSHCDRTPMRLFTERFDPEEKRFRPVRELAPKGQPLKARSIRAANRGRLFAATTASSQRDVEHPRALSAPRAIYDGDPTTAWLEGKAGDGRGESVRFDALLGPARVVAVEIQPRGPVASVGLTIGPKRYLATLRGTGRVRVRLPAPVLTACAEVHLGASQTTDAGLFEVQFLTDVETAGTLADSLAEHVASGAKPQTAGRLLRTLGKDGAVAAEKRLAKPTKEREAARLRAVLADMGAAPEEVAKGLLRLELAPGRRNRLRDGLRRAGPAAVPALLRLLTKESAPVRARRDALDLLVEFRADAALLDSLGRAPGMAGPVARACAKIVPPGQLLTATKDPTRAAGAWRALTRIRPTSPTIADAGIQSWPAPSREQSIYMARAIAVHGAKDALERLADKVLSHSDNAEAIALRRRTVEALLQNPLAETLLVRAARDPDPGVRELALRGIQITPPLAQALDEDPWPNVRIAAAQTLSCPGAGPRAALRRSATRDRNLDVRIAAMTSLAACVADDVLPTFLRLIDNQALPYPVRLEAVRLVAKVQDPKTARELFAREEMIFDEAARALQATRFARAYVTSVAQQTDRGRWAILYRAAEHPAPTVRAEALLRLGPACTQKARALIQAGRQASDRTTRVAANRAWAACR